MLNELSFALPQILKDEVDKELARLKNEDVIGRIWNKDPDVWTGEDESKWLGWLDIVERELAESTKFTDFAAEVSDARFESLVLLGMGGSSLCPEVLAETFGKNQFHILDSTVPAQIESLESKIDVAKTLFIVASKSGSTLEPNTFFQHFYRRVSDSVGGINAGSHFAAITDPGSKLETVAQRDDFRSVFFGDPAVGGRFSALSVFGMIPAAAMGIDSVDFLRRALNMVNACKSHLPNENPGALLGSILGVCHAQGRDKLTIFTSPGINDVGAWLEQLIAESTGKQGVSIIPVDREKIQPPGKYGDDRLFVRIKLSGTNDSDLDRQIDSLAKSGQPVVTVNMTRPQDLGQEFFRWEFATAVAGSIMKINPFNQPDVESAKIEAKKITSEYEETGDLPSEKPVYAENGMKLYTDQANLSALDEIVGKDPSISSYIKAHLSRLNENDYFALLAYIEMNSENEDLLQEIRHNVLEKHQAATCLGFGPRFLHSTGQAYKGGANNGVFLQVTSDDSVDLIVPGQEYTFGVVKSAQARGDFQVLLDRSRRALRIHLGQDVIPALEQIISITS